MADDGNEHLLACEERIRVLLNELRTTAACCIIDGTGDGNFPTRRNLDRRINEDDL